MVSNPAVKELEAQLTSECRARSAAQYSQRDHYARLSFSKVAMISGWPFTSANGCRFVALYCQSKAARWRITMVSASSTSRGRNAKSLRTIRSSAEQVRKADLASNSNRLDRSTRTSSNGSAARSEEHTSELQSLTNL